MSTMCTIVVETAVGVVWLLSTARPGSVVSMTQRSISVLTACGPNNKMLLNLSSSNRAVTEMDYASRASDLHFLSKRTTVHCQYCCNHACVHQGRSTRI